MFSISNAVVLSEVNFEIFSFLSDIKGEEAKTRPHETLTNAYLKLP